MAEPLLEIDGLHIEYETNDEPVRAVTDTELSIGSSDYFGLVGESGCGKSTLARAIVRDLDHNGEVTAGEIRYQGEPIQDLSESEYREKLRWNEISMIPQSSMNSLNPLERVSKQAINIANAHTDWSEERALDRLKELFDIVGLPVSRIHDYPNQFSGGMQQRAIIAMALLLEPSLVIADEPTTALDVIMQDQFLRHLDKLREEQEFSLLLITHDIAVVLELCDELAVMHGGQIAEIGSTEAVFDNPHHPYTVQLQSAFPDIRFPNRELHEIEGTPPNLRTEVDFCTYMDRCPWAESECREVAPPLEDIDGEAGHRAACVRMDEINAELNEYLQERTVQGRDDAGADAEATESRVHREGVEPRLELRDLEKHFSQTSNVIELLKDKLTGQTQPPVRAVDGVDLALYPNEIQGVIGESGCGKSTLLMTLMSLYSPTGGEILFDGTPISEYAEKDLKEEVQIIFQNPFNQINKHFTVREAMMEPLRIHGKERSEERVLEMLERVQLQPAEAYIDRKESELSGGEKQRIAIGRALMLEPSVVLADEPVSMLDVSTQASILKLLDDLASEFDVSMLYISHDLSTVSQLCDRINVMYLGRIVERGPTLDILEDPKHPYTQALMGAIPIPDPHHGREWTQLAGTPGDATDLPTGCRFKDRCPERMDICDERPIMAEVDPEIDHETACHLYYDHETVVGGAASATAESEVEVVQDD